MSDACCADQTTVDAADDDDDDVTSIWGVSEIRAGLVAGALLLTAFLLGLGDLDGWALGLNIAALVVGASTFVPETFKKLARGKIGVGTLMTIAAVGAVILGQVAEAATLAFLYSLSEGLEGYSRAKTRRGLRARWSRTSASRAESDTTSPWSRLTSRAATSNTPPGTRTTSACSTWRRSSPRNRASSSSTSNGLDT